MNVAEIRGFLLIAPKPVKVRVTSIDGSEQELTPKSFARCAETIHALVPEVIHCLDKDGQLLRAKRAGGTPSNPSDEPPLPKAIENDPTAAAFSLYARLLSKAYEHSTEVAFAKMVELVERMNERSDSIEKRLERAEVNHRKAVEQQISDAFDRAEEAAAQQAEGGSDALQSFMTQAFVAGMQQPKPKPPVSTNGASNGARNGKGHD